MDNFSDTEASIFPLLSHLKKNVDIVKKEFFNGFIINNIESNTFANVESNKATKFEARFFWPLHAYPEIHDFSGLVFSKESYLHKTTNDKYIILNNNINIKIRKNELHIKILKQRIGDICQFNKKRKITFPIKGKNINVVLNQTIIPEAEVFETPEDFIRKLSAVSGIFCVEVAKERYVRKIEDHTKIEFSVIKIQQKKWKTICLESKSLQKVLALSFLIHQKEAEKLSYSEFLYKYARDEQATTLT